MPKLTVVDGETYQVAEDKRLILGLRDNGVDILHRCAGNAKCTTCRVEFEAGEPQMMTKAELEKLESQDALGDFRLSCQILCDHDMTVKPLMSVANGDADSPGGRPEENITPDPEWVEKP